MGKEVKQFGLEPLMIPILVKPIRMIIMVKAPGYMLETQVPGIN
jgi:hypothetical protein